MDFCKSTEWLGAWVATAAIFIAACTRDTEPPKETPADFVARASELLNKSARSAELAGFDFRADGSPQHADALALAQLEQGQRQAELWRQAGLYSAASTSPVVERQIRLLRMPPTMAAPFDKKLAAELASVQKELDQYYTNAQECTGRPSTCRKKMDLYDILKDPGRSPRDRLTAWREWHDYGVGIRDRYRQSVELLNRGARDYGFEDAGAVLRAQYDMTPAAFAEEYERLWEQVRPLYESLHCHVRTKLVDRFGPDVSPGEPIPAYLVGDMWGQYWESFFGLMGVPQGDNAVDVTQALENKDLKPEQVVQTAEGFFHSLGFEHLPAQFWKASVLEKNPEKNTDCHASAWPIDPANNDVRLVICMRLKDEDFRTVHHELGHIYYYLAYANQPFLFQDGANPGFHEAIGDTLALSITPDYLQTIGLAANDKLSGSRDLAQLMKVALNTLPSIAMAATVDHWRWKVFSGEIPPERYNRGWWEMVRKYQGLAPPESRGEADFDAGMFFHIIKARPYEQYLIAALLKFDFYRALCKAAGHTGELHRCSFYGSKAAGDRLRAALTAGRSRPWPDTLRELSGSDRIDGAALVEYFAPVAAWLKKQNEGRQCGWDNTTH